MQYPHRRYLLYLLSRRMNAFEVRAECMAKGLVPPNDPMLDEMAKELGTVPKFWRAAVTQDNVPFRRWLRDRGVLEMWVKDSHTEKAIQFLYRHAVRQDFEAVLLAHGNIEQAHDELIIKYPESMVPDVKTLQRYVDFFWDIGAMNPEDIFEFLRAKEGGEKYLPALQGDLVAAYGQLGLQLKVRGEVLLQEIMDAGFQQARRMRSMPNPSGQMLAGMRGVMQEAREAFRDLNELHGAGEEDVSMRRDANNFLARVVQTKAIPSLDELETDNAEVLDVEYAEAGNVRQLPSRRRE